MRASTIFIWTFAILLGFGAVVVARLSGVFTPKTEPAAKKVERQILVAAKNLFAGDTINAVDVRLRPVTAQEQADLDKNPNKYLPAVQQAAALRIAKKNIEADQPITRDLLEDLAKPSALNLRLHPSMRAVNVSLTKDHSVGGLIQVGEWVDVLLTSHVHDHNGNQSTRTATIAKSLRVIAKRNVLWSIFAPLPEDKPVQFTLEANPYQAALIEFGKTKGLITLVAIPASEAQKLEYRRTQALENPHTESLISYGQGATDEGVADAKRLESFLKGQAVGDGDLETIFNLKPPAPPTKTITVEQYFGISRDRMQFDSSNNIIENNPRRMARTASAGRSSSTAYRFSQPECQDCGKNKRSR